MSAPHRAPRPAPRGGRLQARPLGPVPANAPAVADTQQAFQPSNRLPKAFERHREEWMEGQAKCLPSNSLGGMGDWKVGTRTRSSNHTILCQKGSTPHERQR